MRRLQMARFTILFFGLFFSLPLLAEKDTKLIRIATTTTTANTGLTKQLIYAFEKDTEYKVSLTVTGTGRALRLGRDGLVDLLIVHAPNAELKFMQEGHGSRRQYLMKNQFVIVGPKEDPAGIATAQDVSSAFKAIADKQATFISRGDDSGTHKKELAVWQHAGVDPYGDWYFEMGEGMGRSLDYASDVGAYILSDSGTWLAKRQQLTLKELFRGDPMLDNPYHIILVNHDEHPEINQEGATIFMDWILSEKGMPIIRDFSVNDEKLFFPAR